MSAALATEVLEAFSAAGVKEFCVCAGARNVSLVVGLERSSGRRVWHFYDERSAAFFALGRMMRTGAPVAVVTTSGTAVAELLPATVEAYYQSLPLLLLTADRPASFRGSGAPQAIEQVGMMLGYARCLDVSGDAGGICTFLADGIWDESPLHVNVCLEEPGADELERLEGVEFEEHGDRVKNRMLRSGKEEWREVGNVAPKVLVSFLEGDPSGLVVLLGNLRECERFGIGQFLKMLGAPVVAEAGSGLRESLPGLVVRDVPDGTKKVLRIGGVPSMRYWRDLEERPEIEVLSVSRGMFSGLARDCGVVPNVDWKGILISGWFEAGEPAQYGLGEVRLGGETRWFRFLSENIPAGAAVLIGNSLPIREWNQAATFEDRGLRCFSCRGANGIDGQLSTFFGLSVDEGESWAIVGDLTALYDLSAPWILPKLSAGKRRIVVINNGGGRIFSRLPSLRGLAEGERRAIENDHGVSLEHWAAMWGMGYVRVESEEEFVVDDAVEVLVIEIVVSGNE